MGGHEDNKGYEARSLVVAGFYLWESGFYFRWGEQLWEDCSAGMCYDLISGF